MGRFLCWQRLAPRLVLLFALSACVPQVPPTLPRSAQPETAGVVERVMVTAARTDLAQTPVCGGARLATSLKSGSRGGYAPPGSYLVGPGDNLKFNIFGEAGMTDITARVDDAGFVQLPMVELVQVSGQTTRDIQAQLKQAYTAFLSGPWVTVELVQAQSAPMYFLGEFNQSGVIYMNGATDILQAVALAGGLTGEAYLPGARLLRDNHVCTVDLNALLRNGDFSQNVWIKPRDVIFAPRKEDMSVYVLGAVGAPQSIAYGADGRTLMQALTMAGGPQAGVAQLGAIRIIRSTTPTTGELIVFDARKALTGRGLDLPLEPGDVIYVPSTELGDWNAAVAQILPSLQLLGGILTPITLIQNLKASDVPLCRLHRPTLLAG
jgi:polysaccharide export outer membrane protein